jgi:hypothetical protein
MIFSYGQEEEADTEDDDEYVPPTLIMDTELDYGEIEPEASSKVQCCGSGSG